MIIATLACFIAGIFGMGLVANVIDREPNSLATVSFGLLGFIACIAIYLTGFYFLLA